MGVVGDERYRVGRRRKESGTGQPVVPARPKTGRSKWSKKGTQMEGRKDKKKKRARSEKRRSGEGRCDG